MKIINKINILCVSLFLMCACSLTGNKAEIEKEVQNSSTTSMASVGGMIAVVDSIPMQVGELTPNMLQFLSSDSSVEGNWLLIDTHSNTVSIKNGNQTLEVVKIIENIGVTPGVYSVMSMEENPLWYANDNYYLLRNLTPPDKFAKERYVKGALGNFAVYINNEIAIHDSQIESLDVMGVRVDTTSIKKIYSSLKNGALIKVY